MTKAVKYNYLHWKTNPKGHSNNFALTQYNYNDIQTNLELRLQQTYVCVDNENTYTSFIKFQRTYAGLLCKKHTPAKPWVYARLKHWLTALFMTSRDCLLVLGIICETVSIEVPPAA